MVGPETSQSADSKPLFSIEKQYYLTLFRSWTGMVGSLDLIFWYFLILFVKILVPNEGYTSSVLGGTPPNLVDKLFRH